MRKNSVNYFMFPHLDHPYTPHGVQIVQKAIVNVKTSALMYVFDCDFLIMYQVLIREKASTAVLLLTCIRFKRRFNSFSIGSDLKIDIHNNVLNSK